MKTNTPLLRLIAASLVIVATLAGARAQSSQVPNLINYQGFVADNDGVPIANANPENKSIEFRIYPSATGGAALWGETQVVTIFKGNFSVLLGNGLQIDVDTPTGGENLAATFDGAERYLGVTLQGEAEFSPRQRIVTTAFAFRAKVAEKVENASIATDSLGDATVTNPKIVDASVSTTKIQDLSVTSSKIANSSVTSVKIVDGSIALEDLVIEVQRKLMPPGTVVAWAGVPTTRVLGDDTYSGVPNGWIICDGRSLSRAAYPGLFSAIGYIYGGSGDNFNVPNYLGYFLRGQTLGAEDPDRGSRTKASDFATTHNLNEGSTQGDTFKAHTHGNGDYKRLIKGYSNKTVVNGGAIIGKTTTSASLLSGSADNLSVGGSETRPKNKYVWYIIKAD